MLPQQGTELLETEEQQAQIEEQVKNGNGYLHLIANICFLYYIKVDSASCASCDDQSAETTILMPITTTMPLPRRCPKCKSIRWNQRYLDEELSLIDRLQDELYETGLIRESGEILCLYIWVRFVVVVDG